MSKKPMISHHVASAASRLRHVFVRDLELMALIGIYEHEKTDPQRIIVNIDLSVREGEGARTTISVMWCPMRSSCKKVESIVAEGHINLVETLCEKIAASCLTDKRVHGGAGAGGKARHHSQCAQRRCRDRTGEVKVPFRR